MIASPNELIYFVEVTKELNFSRAAERIGISQPSLSAAMKRLEQSIGEVLFIRSKSGVSLTQAGKRLLSHSKELLQLWDTVKSASLASHHEVQGCYSIGCHTSVALYTLPKFLPKLLAEYPKLEIQIKHALSRQILADVISLDIDVGIVVNPVKHPDLILQKLMNDTVMFWQSAEVKTQNQNLYSGDAVIICDQDLHQAQWLLKKLHKQGVKYQRIITSSNLEVIASLTAAGAGIGILPSRVATAAFNKQLKPLNKLPNFQDEIYLAYRHENRAIKAIQSILTAIKSANYN